MTSSAALATALSGPDLRRMFTAAAAWLDRNAAAVNAINVFPVPDGDTGTNMALTLRAAVAEAAAANDEVGPVVEALARGALMGARGNSGVILSQYLKGLAARLATGDRVDPPRLAAGLSEAAATAYRTVTRPVEGTILTVARAAGEAAGESLSPESSIEAVLRAAVAGARAALARTPDLLPVLREAGVVDSGGLGLCVTLEGALFGLRGEDLPAAAADAGQIDRDWLSARREAHEGAAEFGYCIEFTVRDSQSDDEALRAALLPLGGSLLVVGDAGLYHVHLHAENPGPALSIGAGAGRLSGVKVEDMDEQAERLARAEGQRQPVALGPYGVIAVAAGEGLARALYDAGAAAVVTGGQTMNPSTRDLLDAVRSARAERAIILPNNKNIIWTAEQAATLADKPVIVVPTRSIPQGLAALLALNPDDDPEAVQEAMAAAARRVHTVEVTRAARSVSLGGVSVRQGEPIALVDDELTAAGADATTAAMAALRTLAIEVGSLVTLFRGDTTTEQEAANLAAEIRSAWPDVEIDSREGGQPFYSFIISVE